MTLNNPNCPSCAEGSYTITPPPMATITDRGRVTLQAGVPKLITFTNISVLSESSWVFAGVPTCYSSGNEAVGYDIITRTGTGFWVTALEDSTFEYMCVKI